MRDTSLYTLALSYIKELRLRNTCGVAYNNLAIVYPAIQAMYSPYNLYE